MRVINCEYDARSNPISVTCEDDGKTYEFNLSRHAKWIRAEGFTDIMTHAEYCSLCGCSVQVNGMYTAYGVGYYYCPGCGAQMDLKEIRPQDHCTSYRDGRCLGTREVDPCSCNGDQAQCDFYDYIRERVNKVKE